MMLTLPPDQEEDQIPGGCLHALSSIRSCKPRFATVELTNRSDSRWWFAWTDHMGLDKSGSLI
jgi:hypothetical protein